jgi:hypothetical protein
VAERTRQMAETDKAEQVAQEQYIRQVLAKPEGSAEADGKSAAGTARDAPSPRQDDTGKRAQVLNELLADQDFNRLGNLLAKQMVEKEQYLKLLLAQYAEQRLSETTATKDRFKRDFDLLDDLKAQGKIADAPYREARKKLAVQEANAARDLELTLERAHKEEEAQLRQEMDARHSEEQVALQRAQAETNFKLRTELLGEREAAEEQNLDKKALEKFAAVKRQEQEKRQRQTEAGRRAIAQQIDQQLQDKIGDHEELLRRRKEAAAAAHGAAAELY